MKILCTSSAHQDSTPSMEVYPDGHAYCFSCGYYVPAVGPEIELPTARAPEDLRESLGLIQALPRASHRGLPELPTSRDGFYIVWPDNSYYKLRKFKDDPRYLAPRGHAQPLLGWNGDSGIAIIVEGELNALSLASQTDYTVISPGGASGFDTLREDLLEACASYDKILVWTDRDPAGIKALWRTVPYLLDVCPDVRYITTEEDANNILVSQGGQALRDCVERILE